MREIREPDLSALTSIHLGGRALALLMPESEEDLALLPGKCAQYGGKPFFIGRGSNLLAKDGLLPLVLISMAAFDKIRLDKEQNRVVAGAGVPLPRLLRFCAAHNLSGFEGLCGIPGSVGGACAMNAGSFGSETGELLSGIKAWTRSGFKTYGREALDLSYRSLKLASGAPLPLIAEAIFALTPCRKSVILGRMNLNYLKKKSRQPLTVWSAGCAFKNPANAAAGEMLERAGMRGRELGGMRFSEKHANFLVNTGAGSPMAALELLAAGREAVAERFGVWLEPEIRIIP